MRFMESEKRLGRQIVQDEVKTQLTGENTNQPPSSLTSTITILMT
jgi:hypothetical protein